MKLSASILGLFCLTTFSPAAPGDKKAEPEKLFGANIARGIETIDLPFIDEDTNFELDLRPKFSDIFRRPYIRLPLEASYAFSPQFETSIGYTPFLNSPFKSDPINSKGYLHFGIKRVLKKLAQERLALAVGFDSRFPLERIPGDWERNNFKTYSPYVVAAYEIDKSGEWTLFSNLRYDALDVSSNRIGATTAPPSLARITIGGIHHPKGDFRYSLRALYLTERFDGGDDDGLKIIPSVTWYPPEDTRFLRSIVGHFEFTLDLEWAVAKLSEQRDESDLGLNLGVRWSLIRKVNRAKDDVVRSR